MSRPATKPLVRITEGSSQVHTEARSGPRSSIAAADMLSAHYDAGDKSHPPESSQREPKCFFLKVPGELRNRIYREVLIQPDSVTVELAGYERPALLHTCKQVRQEATSIFFQENVFRFVIDDYDSTSIARFRRHIPPIKIVKGGHKAELKLRLCSPNWPNLLAWLWQKYQYDCLPSPPPSYLLQRGAGSDEMPLYVMGGMFEIAKQAKAAGISWSVAKQMIEAQRPLLIAMDSQWALDAT